MSGSQWNALNLTPYDPIKVPSAMAALAQQQAQTQGEQIKNAMAGLQLGKANMLYGAAGIGPGATQGGPVQQQAMPWSGAATGAGPSALPPSGSPIGLTAPVAGGGGAAPARPALAGGDAGPGGPAVFGADRFSEPGELGIRTFGTPMPPWMAMAAGDSSNPNAMKDALETRRLATYSIMNVPDSQWNSAVRRAYDSGYITADTARATFGRPELREKVLAAYATPDAHSSLIGALARNGVQQSNETGQLVPSPGIVAAKGLMAGAEAGATLRYKIAEHAANASTDTKEDLNRKIQGIRPAADQAAAIAGATYHYDVAKATEKAKAEADAAVDRETRLVGPRVSQADQIRRNSVEPDTQLAGNKAAIEAGYAAPIEMLVKGSDGVMRNVYVPRSQIPQLGAGARPANVADRQDPGISVSPSSFVQRAAQFESGGQFGAGNPRLANGQAASSAGGGLQFTDDTWRETLAGMNPALVAGKTEQQIQAMKYDNSPAGQALQRQAGAALADNNARKLAAAGLPVNTYSVGLAHQFGAAGAGKVMAAPSNVQMSTLFPPTRDGQNPVMAANPQFYGKTVGDVRGKFLDHYGVNGYAVGGGGGAPAPGSAAPGGAAAPDAAAGPAPAPVAPVGASPLPPAAGGAPAAPVAAPAPAPAPASGLPEGLPPGTIEGAPKDTPEQAAARAVQTKEREALAEGYGQTAAAIQKAAGAAPGNQVLLDTLTNSARTFRTGATGPLRLDAAKAAADALQSIGIDAPRWLTDPAAAGETIEKAGGFLTSAMVKSLGSREAASVFNQVKSFNPNIAMSQGGFAIVVDSIKQGLQRDQDLGRFQDQWLADPSHNHSIAGMQAAFDKVLPVQVYASRVVPYPAPRSAADFIPNVIYRSAQGQVGKWNGQKMVAPE